MGHYDEAYEEMAEESRKHNAKRRELELRRKQEAIFNSDLPDFSKNVA